MKKKETEIIEQTEDQEVEVVEKESTAKRVLNVVINVLLVVAILLAAVCTYVSYVSSSGTGVPSILGVSVFSIQTESMYPTLQPGDLIFDTTVKDPSTLRKGDIITYWTTINGETVFNTHRIHEIYDGGNGKLIFSTKGDNNATEDPLTVHQSSVVGKYSFRVGGLGKVFDYLQTSTGFLIVVVVPVFLFFLFHLVQFFRTLFEYQNVKNRIKYEQERGRTEDLIEKQNKARQAMEDELREKMRAEILASMAAAQKAVPPVEEKKEEPAEEPAAEETPAEEPAAEPAVQEPEEKAEEAKPAMDEAAIEAMIAQQRAAIEAELREKLRAEFLAEQAAKEEQNAEEAEAQ